MLAAANSDAGSAGEASPNKLFRIFDFHQCCAVSNPVEHLLAARPTDEPETKGIVVLLHVLGQRIETGAFLLQDGHGCWGSPGTGPVLSNPA